jgi:hypothetical protein
VDSQPKYPPTSIHSSIVSIPARHFVVFRGDLVHAGNSSAEDNLLCHVFFDHPSIHREPDTTQIITHPALDYFVE